jgi:hypothetical protein
LYSWLGHPLLKLLVGSFTNPFRTVEKKPKLYLRSTYILNQILAETGCLTSFFVGCCLKWSTRKLAITDNLSVTFQHIRALHMLQLQRLYFLRADPLILSTPAWVKSHLIHRLRETIPFPRQPLLPFWMSDL